MNKLKQFQNGSKDSTNMQVGQVVINKGLGYSEVKEICTDLFKENFIKLKNEALIKVEERIEVFINEYIKKLKLQGVEDTSELTNPDMQYVLYEAEKSYARYGNDELLNILTNILVERTQNNNNLIKLNLNEALEVIPKLTQEHMDILKIIFILRYTKMNGIFNINQLISYLEIYIKPVCDISMLKDSIFMYLTYVGCGNVLFGDNLEKIFSNSYPDVFKEEQPKSLITKILTWMKHVFEIWGFTNMYCLDLTSVGITIGYSNLYARTGIKLDLSIWI